ncbi:MAG TPA: FtsX-like permease family protein, partial [Vicinamibacterales bacterium]
AGVTRERAAAELEARWAHLVPPPATGLANRFLFLDGAQGLNDLRAQFSAPLVLVFAAVALLLLLACANLASLVLARNRSREHEVALRLALGAGRSRIARQLFAESLVLALLAGGAGLVFASWASRTIVTLLSRGRTPILIDVGLDARIVLFAFAISVVTSVLFGMWPALKASRANLQPELQAGARTLTRAPALGSRSLIAAQTILSIVLVVAAVLFARSLTKLYRADLGLDKRRVLIVGIGFGISGARNTAPMVVELSDRLSDTAGIRSVTQMMDLPFGGTSYRAGVSVSGRPESADDQVGYNFVGPRFFETMGIPLLEGRDFRADDDARGRAVAVVSRSLAVRFFAARSAIGERLQLQGAAEPVEIVGVAKDVPYEGVRAERELVLYRPQRQAPLGAGTFAIRADLPPSAVLEVVKLALHDVAPSVPIVSIMTLEDLFDGSIATERLLSNIAVFFGVMALLLVAIGMYGTLASALAERTREFGVRLALGATGGDIVRMIVSGALLPVVWGLGAGLPMAFAGTRLARSTLFGITPRDPATYLVSAGAVLLIAAVAAMPPALAAIRGNPIAALRQN